MGKKSGTWMIMKDGSQKNVKKLMLLREKALWFKVLIKGFIV